MNGQGGNGGKAVRCPRRGGPSGRVVFKKIGSLFEFIYRIPAPAMSTDACALSCAVCTLHWD